MISRFWPFNRWFRPQRTAIRAARMRDAPRFAAIHAQSFAIGWDQANFEMMLGDHRHIADTLTTRGIAGERIIGFAISRTVIDEAELLTIALAPDARGRGLAHGLALVHAGHLARAGIKAVFLEVAMDNAPALALYRRLGFMEIGRRKGYYPQRGATEMPRDALHMRWDLTAFDATPRPFM